MGTRVSSNDTRDEVFMILDIANDHIKIKAKVDTGAQANVLPYHIYNFAKKKPTYKHAFTYSIAYDNTPIPLKGTANIQCIHNGITYNIPFYIAHTNSCPIIGLPTCRELQIITFIAIYH